METSAIRPVHLAATGGMGIAAHEAGPKAGPVVLLAPGWPQTAHCWRRVQPILAEAGYRSLALDSAWHGRVRPAAAGRGL